jgi:hypothetical protein
MLLAHINEFIEMFAHIIILTAAQIHQVLLRVSLKQRFRRIQYIFGPLAFDVLKMAFG